MMIYGNATDEEYAQSMRGTGNRYAQAASASPARRAGSGRKRRLQRRSPRMKAGPCARMRPWPILTPAFPSAPTRTTRG